MAAIDEFRELIGFKELEGRNWDEQFQRWSASSGMYEEGDGQAPFFTEAFLYNLLGKDDARSLLSIVRRLGKSLGVETQELP